jgi:D-aminopeptidase
MECWNSSGENMTRKIVAWLNLAWHFGVHVLTRLPVRAFRAGKDLRRLTETVEPEGYVPLAPAERADFPRYMGCIHCGLCALPCTSATQSAWGEAWTFVGGASRSLDRAPLVARDLTECVDLPEPEAVCPMGIPIRQMGATIRRMAVLTLVFASVAGAQTSSPNRPRARDAGVIVGVFPTGQHNAITDVAGVLVGQTTVVEGNVRTGVTAILPHAGNAFLERVPAAVHVANAYGKLAGSLQVKELGELETPILLTCTLCVWKAADAMVEWMLAQPGMENVRSVNPLVGETNDGALNDIRTRPIRAEHVRAALESAKAGPVEEGGVGAGAGTIAFAWKGGIGTSSRILPASLGGYTVGVLVQTNYGGILTINGAPVGRELGQYAFRNVVEKGDGSVMIVVATDAPLDARNLERLATRAITGLARTGSSMSNGSGDFVIAFSTASSVRRVSQSTPRTIADLPNDGMSGLFQAVAEATEEAIYNSLFKAQTVSSNGMTVEALPLDKTLDVLRRYRAVK